MRSLRMNCLGDRPCELEMLSDKSEVFEGAFNHVNYEDPDINISLPVFSIHGNHDDPTGEGHLASLDLLQIGGLVNYYGRTHESDNINVKPILLQKGRTKLALYGMSNVRDERLFRTWRDGKVKFFKPSTQGPDWFNIMSVHQNHHAYTEKGYLPENFLPDFMDLVIWGHEHECKIDPRYNPDMKFHVMQPGSSVATSLMPGEAVPKHVSIVSVTGRDFKCEPILLKTVRPFVMREIVLSEDKVAKGLAKKESNRNELSRRLNEIVEELIAQAKREWLEVQDPPEDGEELKCPDPLVRLRVEYSAPDGGHFDCENPQRFSATFQGRVANAEDIVQFHRRKNATTKQPKGAVLPEQSVLAQLSIDSTKVSALVKEFLAAQSLTILPQNSFGDAMTQFVDKDDKHAMETFVQESLKSQVEHLLELDREDEEEDIASALESNKSKLEELFATGHLKRATKARLKPKPDMWDSEADGGWADQPGALVRSDAEGDMDDDDDQSVVAAPAKGRSKVGSKTTVAKKAPVKKTAVSRRKKAVSESDDDGEGANGNDAMSIDESDEEDDLFVKPKAPASKVRKAVAAPVKAGNMAGKATKTTPLATRKPPTRAAVAAKPAQSQSSIASWAMPGNKTVAQSQIEEISDDDDDDAFEPIAKPGGRRR